jgi:ABC-type dipeptide/oligopeptide/nickel transport system permease component
VFLNYLIKHLFSTVFVLLGITTLVFLLIHLVSGDPVEVMLGETARPADREALRHALGLDLPVLQLCPFLVWECNRRQHPGGV